MHRCSTHTHTKRARKKTLNDNTRARRTHIIDTGVDTDADRDTGSRSTRGCAGMVRRMKGNHTRVHDRAIMKTATTAITTTAGAGAEATTQHSTDRGRKRQT